MANTNDLYSFSSSEVLPYHLFFVELNCETRVKIQMILSSTKSLFVNHMIEYVTGYFNSWSSLQICPDCTKTCKHLCTFGQTGVSKVYNEALQVQSTSQWSSLCFPQTVQTAFFGKTNFNSPDKSIQILDNQFPQMKEFPKTNN